MIGICDTVLLIRGLSCKEEKAAPQSIVAFSAALTLIHICFITSRQETDSVITVTLACVYFFIYLTLFASSGSDRRSVRYTACVLIVTAVLGGGFVNPLQRGISSAEETTLVREIRKTGEEDSVWFVESGYPLTNLPLLAGKRVADSTQAYSNPDKWRLLDREGQYEEI